MIIEVWFRDANKNHGWSELRSVPRLKPKEIGNIILAEMDDFNNDLEINCKRLNRSIIGIHLSPLSPVRISNKEHNWKVYPAPKDKYGRILLRCSNCGLCFRTVSKIEVLNTDCESKKTCTICNRVFPEVSGYKKHWRTYHG